MDVLIGSTGFVGGHIALQHEFDLAVHRTNVDLIRGCDFQFLVCAGLPAAKWVANKNPEADWQNTQQLASVLSSTTAHTAVLISTLDVYQPPVGLDEETPAYLAGNEAYGRNRAWFEAFFASRFHNHLILRLPALVANDLRKNLVFDLIHKRHDQLSKVNPDSEFQFFDVRNTWHLVMQGLNIGTSVFNVTSEPIRACDIAQPFSLQVSGGSPPIKYDIKSLWADSLGGTGGYLYSRAEIMAVIHDIVNENDKR